ncbi:MAG: hypothetical protein JW802_09230 [Campylobacterales bacterium]|nr:hypothetical protein [Campylobacterales bacterium]MBN2831888.1 hypothetical protein [Campylobacterales bacterium]
MNRVDTKKMLSAILLKEWVKLRLLVWVPFLVLLAVLIDTHMRYKGVVASHGASALWLDLIYKQSIYFMKLKWVLIGGGIWFASLQFLPECSNKRLRLLFHIPVAHQVPMCAMLFVGIGMMAVLFLGAYIGLAGVFSLYYFPKELSSMMLQTTLPWALAGFVAYCATAAVIAQASVYKKLAFVFLGYVYVGFLTETNGFNAFNDLGLYALSTLPWLFVFEAAALGVKESYA